MMTVVNATIQTTKLAEDFAGRDFPVHPAARGRPPGWGPPCRAVDRWCVRAVR